MQKVIVQKRKPDGKWCADCVHCHEMITSNYELEELLVFVMRHAIKHQLLLTFCTCVSCFGMLEEEVNDRH